MNQNLSAPVAISILLFFGAALAGVFWAGNAALAVRSFSHLHHHPNGDLFVQFDNELLAIGPDGSLRAAYDLKDFGLAPEGGDFAFFGNGDLLIRRDTPPRNLQFNIDRYLRKPNETPPKLLEGESNLVRCDLQARQCRPLPRAALNLNDAHYLEIDRDTDRIFVADSSRHRILMLNAEGLELARIETGLKFPNQIVYREGQLYVANTNFHTISIYPVTDKGFESPRPPVAVAVKQARATGRVWPASLALIDNITWVESAQTCMCNGGVFRFDAEHNYLGQVALPADADPYGIAPLGGQVLITDFSNDRIYNVDREGRLLGEFESSPINDRLKVVKEQRAYYRTIKNGFIGLFVLGFLVGFFFALRGDGEPKQAATETNDDIEQGVLIDDPLVVWVSPDKTGQVKTLLWLIPLFGFLAPFIVLFIFKQQTGAENFDLQRSIPIIIVAITLLLITTFAWIKQFQLLRSRLGALGNWLILVDHKGRWSAGRGPEITYSDQFVTIGKLIILLRMGQFPLFRQSELIRHIYPLLEGGTCLSATEGARYLLQRSLLAKGAFAVALLALIGGFLYFLLQ